MRLRVSWKPSQRGLILLWIAALSLLYLTVVQDADFWWHLSTARWMVEHGRIPETDPFSFSAAGFPWTNVNWLGDLILWGAYQAGGFGGVTVLKSCSIGLTLVILGDVSRRLQVSPGAFALLALLLALMLQGKFAVARPATFSAPLVAGALWICVRTLTDERGKEGDPRLAFALPLYCAIWMQIHASALLVAPLAAGLALLPWCTKSFGAVGRAFSDHEWQTKSKKFGLLAAGLVAVLFIATDRGRGILTHGSAYDESSLVVQMTLEWARVDFSLPATWVAIAFLIMSIVGSLLTLRLDVTKCTKTHDQKRAHALIRAAVLTLALALLGALIGLRYIRHTALGLVFAAPGVALALADARRRLSSRWPALVGTLLIAIPALLYTARWPVNQPFGFGVPPKRYSTDTLDVLRELPPGKTLNGFALGGYLIWQKMPGGVFIDGRTVQVYDEEFLREFYKPLKDPMALEQIADKFQITYGLVRSDTREARALMKHPDWLPLYFGATSTLLIRRGAVAQATQSFASLRLAPFEELRFVDNDEWMSAYYGALLNDPTRQMTLTRELRRASRTDAFRRSQALPGIIRHLKKHHLAFLKAADAPRGR